MSELISRERWYDGVEYPALNMLVQQMNEGIVEAEGPFLSPTNIYSTLAFPRLIEHKTSDEGKHRDRWNSFSHYKMTAEPGGISIPVYAPTDIYVTSINEGQRRYHRVVGHRPMYAWRGFGVEVNNPFLGLPPLYDPSLQGTAFVAAPSNLADLKTASLRKMLPDLKSELSLLNSLIELKDFKSLPHTIEAVSHFTYIGARSIAQYLRFLRHATGKTRTLADAYLQLKFNLQPLVSDVNGIFRSLSNLEKRLNALLTSAARPQHKHFAYTWKEFEDADETSDPYQWDQYPYLYGSNFTHRRTNYESTKFHAEVEYNVTFLGYQIEHARLLFLLDSLGINGNPSIIWNAIPWSFVIDWLVGVSAFLNRFKVSNMEPEVNIRQYLWSVKRVRRCSFEKTLGVSWPFIPVLKRVPCYTTNETAYRREVDSLTTGSITLSGLSPTEFSLGAALVLARRRRPNRQ
jgi:hypothetical protein